MSSIPSEIAEDELLARYIFSKRHIRQDNTVRQDAFVPHPHTELSVNRHLDLSDEEIDSFGLVIAKQRHKGFLGRASFKAAAALHQTLFVIADPICGNKYHADVKGWPKDKAQQKMMATKLANRAGFVPFA